MGDSTVSMSRYGILCCALFLILNSGVQGFEVEKKYFGGSYNFVYNPCKNKGTWDGYRGTCTCPEGFSGARCETGSGACADVECKNGGWCSLPSGYCRCNYPYYGTRCEK